TEMDGNRNYLPKLIFESLLTISLLLGIYLMEAAALSEIPQRRRDRGALLDVKGEPLLDITLPASVGAAFDAFQEHETDEEFRRLILSSICHTFDNYVLVPQVTIKTSRAGSNAERGQRMLAYSMVALMVAVKEATPENVAYLKRRWSALATSVGRNYKQNLTDALGLAAGYQLVDHAVTIKRLTKQYIDTKRVVMSLLEEVSKIPALTVALRTQVAMIYAYHGMSMIRLMRDYTANPVQLPFCITAIAREALAFREAYAAVVAGVPADMIPYLFILRGDLPRLHQSHFPNLLAIVRATYRRTSPPRGMLAWFWTRKRLISLGGSRI
ncbi:hypothetical protein BOX15_Mlig002085g1, partial [Macrostomum lignano]